MSFDARRARQEKGETRRDEAKSGNNWQWATGNNATKHSIPARTHTHTHILRHLSGRQRQSDSDSDVNGGSDSDSINFQLALIKKSKTHTHTHIYREGVGERDWERDTKREREKEWELGTRTNGTWSRCQKLRHKANNWLSLFRPLPVGLKHRRPARGLLMPLSVYVCVCMWVLLAVYACVLCAHKYCLGPRPEQSKAGQSRPGSLNGLHGLGQYRVRTYVLHILLCLSLSPFPSSFLSLSLCMCGTVWTAGEP